MHWIDILDLDYLTRMTRHDFLRIYFKSLIFKPISVWLTKRRLLDQVPLWRQIFVAENYLLIYHQWLLILWRPASYQPCYEQSSADLDLYSSLLSLRKVFDDEKYCHDDVPLPAGWKFGCSSRQLPTTSDTVIDSYFVKLICMYSRLYVEPLWLLRL